MPLGMSKEEFISRLDQAWAEIPPHIHAIKWIAKLGLLTQETMKPGTSLEQIQDINERLIKLCATVVAMEIEYRQMLKEEMEKE